MSDIIFTKQATPATPSAGKVKQYVKTTGQLAILNDAGVETVYSTGGVTDHTLLTNIGTNTHSQIDTALTRLANTSGTNTGDQNLSGLVVGNAAITPGTNLKITYDAKGLVTAGTTAILDDLLDTVITAPITGEILQYNGTNFINAPLVIPTSAGAGVSYYLSSTASAIPTYSEILTIPDVGIEVDETVIVNNNTIEFERYITNSAGLGTTSIDAGQWVFNLSTFVSAPAGASFLDVNVFSRTAGGVETFLFTCSTDEINNATVALHTITLIQPAFTISPTDHLVVKFSGRTTATSNKTIHLVHSGTVNYSFINTPLLTRHNELVGIQGGTSAERYHLTAAQATVVANTSGVNTGDQNLSGLVVANAAITGATNTKITYDSKGLVTSGSTATTADIADSLNKRYVTDANLVVIGNTSGINSGDETATTIKSKLGITTLSGSNTGDQAISDATITTTDITTNNFSTAKHGFVPKGTNVGSFLKDNGAWATIPTPVIGTPAVANVDINKGDLVIYSIAGEVDKQPLSYNGAVFVAQAQAFATNGVTLLTSGQITGLTITGAVIGDYIYWDGAALTKTKPTGANIWIVGVYSNTGTMDIRLERVKSITTIALESATTTVSINTATAPTAGQVLRAVSGTSASWQTLATGGAATKVEVELDFGIVSRGMSFTITDALVVSTDMVNMQYSGKLATGRNLDEYEFEAFECHCIPGTGNFIARITPLLGAVGGKYKFFYQQ
jgi:hypothetical protein